MARDEAGARGDEDAVGRHRSVDDVLSLSHARALAATLDADPASLDHGAPLPPAWHWIYFHGATPQSELAEDGHERLGDFLPDLGLPRRMWAGGRIRVRDVLRIGDEARLVSTVRTVERKSGRSGPLGFVTVEHRISGRSGVAIEEEQQLVYLEPRTATSPRRGAQLDGTASAVAAPAAAWREPFVADEVTLFRFSALTFNGHRIHYDHRYATEVEGYPDLVVHGPLLALLLVGAGVRHRPGSGEWAPLDFRYRARRPLFCNEPFHVAGRPADEAAPGGDAAGEEALELWAAHAERGVAMEARLDFG